MSSLLTRLLGRRSLQITVGALTAIPFASGLAGMVAGPSTLPGGPSTITPSLDSEYRFINAFWFALAPIIWSTLPRIDENSPRLRLAMATVFVGGLARILSWKRNGRPHPVFVAVIGLEIVGMPLIAAWQQQLVTAKNSRKAQFE